MGAGRLGKKQPRPALTCKPAEEEEGAGLDWIAMLMLHVNVYHLQLGVADGTFVGMSAALQRWATEPSSWIKKKI